MNSLTIASVAGRTLIAILFILAGVAKAFGPQPFLDHMAAFGVPSFFLPAVIALEIGGGVALAIGWRLRDAAIALSAFCVIAAVVFHHEFGKPAERTLFLKDLAIAGGLLALAASAEASRRARIVSMPKA